MVPYSDTTNDLVRMFNVPDPIRYALSRPLYAEPGALFDYCNASTNILGDVVRRATGRRLDHFADTVLLAPLGITTRRWYRMSEDVVLASGDLELTAEGHGQARPALPGPGRVERTKGGFHGLGGPGDRPHRPTCPGARLGGLVRLRLVALGPGGRRAGLARVHGQRRGGQWIVVVPSADLVFVSTGGNYDRPEPMSARRMLEAYVLAGLR